MVTVDLNTPPEGAGTINVPEGHIEEVDGTPVSTRLKVGESKTVIDNKPLKDFFNDANFAGTAGTDTRGDTLTLSVEIYPDDATATTVANGTATVLPMDKQVVAAVLSRDTWTGDDAAKFSLTLTGLRGSSDLDDPADGTIDVQVVALIAEDEFGMKAAQTFTVRVNHKPKAEGPQDKPKTLRTETDHRDLKLAADGAAGTEVPIIIVGETAGYFSDGDGFEDFDECVYTVTGDAVTAVLADSSGTKTLTVTPMKVGTTTVEIYCVDDAGESSDPDTLTLTVIGRAASVQ